MLDKDASLLSLFVLQLLFQLVTFSDDSWIGDQLDLRLTCLQLLILLSESGQLCLVVLHFLLGLGL